VINLITSREGAISRGHKKKKKKKSRVGVVPIPEKANKSKQRARLQLLLRSRHVWPKKSEHQQNRKVRQSNGRNVYCRLLGKTTRKVAGKKRAGFARRNEPRK
jgi:hypothetical protein